LKINGFFIAVTKNCPAKPKDYGAGRRKKARQRRTQPGGLQKRQSAAMVAGYL
jgi:hypothetical protein